MRALRQLYSSSQIASETCYTRPKSKNPTRQPSRFGIHWKQVASLFCRTGFAFDESSSLPFPHALALRPIVMSMQKLPQVLDRIAVNPSVVSNVPYPR